MQRDLATGEAAVFLMVDEVGRVQGYYILRDLRGQGIGTDLILHAPRQAARAAETVASYAVILDANPPEADDPVTSVMFAGRAG